MSRSLGIPVKLLHEAAGHVVTVELKTGEVYRGSMIECEDNWNCQIENITFTAKVFTSSFSPPSPPSFSWSHLEISCGVVGRQGVAAGARLHQGQQGQVHDHPRHAQERTHVQAPRGQDKGAPHLSFSFFLFFVF
uniref:Small nuclear ribonucleoprotein Sm D3 n=1 Tax=Aegilops tauschii subsp. strangulata TaxID=200361 RepID=A0A453JCR1_AEGTS